VEVDTERAGGEIRGEIGRGITKGKSHKDQRGKYYKRRREGGRSKIKESGTDHTSVEAIPESGKYDSK
jgi:hypothetical protein